MKQRRSALGEITTQYARNGPLLEESRQFTRLAAAHVPRLERRRLLVDQNELGRVTYKARRNIFEALDARFADDNRAANLGLLAGLATGGRSHDIGVLLEIARHDMLIGRFLQFLTEHFGESTALVDARYFLDSLDRELGVVRGWAPSLQSRAIAALNRIPDVFRLWSNEPGSRVAVIDPPIELMGLIVQERLQEMLPPLGAREFAMLGIDRPRALDLLWACARRNWFKVDVAGDVVRLEPQFSSVAAMFGLKQSETAL